MRRAVWIARCAGILCFLAGWVVCGQGIDPAVAQGQVSEDSLGLEAIPAVVQQVSAVYPDSLRRRGLDGRIEVHVLIGTDGKVQRALATPDRSPLAPYALAAARRWTFRPPAVNGKTLPCWLELQIPFNRLNPTDGPAQATPLVQISLVQPGDGVDPNGPPFLGTIRMHIGADGFVDQASFLGPAPADSTRILQRARRWIWQPAHDSTGAAVDVWATLRVSARAGATVIEHPDQALGAVLGQANFAEVSTADSAGGGWRKREVDPLVFANVFADWISDPHAYEADDPWRSRCPPIFETSIVFEGPTRALRADLARNCAFMRVLTKDRVLFVPYARTRTRIDADLAKVFASPQAFSPVRREIPRQQ